MISLPKRARPYLAAGAIALICALPIAAGAKPFLEADTSRWGADYHRFTVSSGGAEACATACAEDAQCHAWSYIKPGVTGPTGECRLKSAVPQGESNPCCISGIAAGTSAGVLAGFPSDDKHTSMATATPSKPPASGLTGATKPGSVGTKPKEDDLQMPFEAETPEALKAIAAPVSLVPPAWIESHD